MKNKIIELAKSKLGNDYKESCQAMGFGYRVEWCACFISMLAKKLDITDIIPVDTSCNSQIYWFQSRGVWHTDRNFKPGDIIYYDWDRLGDSRPADHVGIVVDVYGDMITVIEGNKGNYPDDKVGERVIDKNSNLIFGYARPRYPVSNENNISIHMSSELKKGCTGYKVKCLQILLSELNNQKIEADGIFGSETESAVKFFQKNHGCEIDGIVGKQTYTEMLQLLI